MPKFVDLTGKRFGARIAIVRTFPPLHLEKTGKNRPFWKTRCDCGVEQVVSSGGLKTHNSCGCLSREATRKRLSKPFGEASRNNLYTRHQINAALRGYQFTLSVEECEVLWKSDCHYCGVPPIQVAKNIHRRFNGAYLHNGIDRADNTMGYIQGNCLPCCKRCNYMKRAMPYEEFIQHIARMAKNLGVV